MILYRNQAQNYIFCICSTSYRIDKQEIKLMNLGTEAAKI